MIIGFTGSSHGIPPAGRPPLTYDGRGRYDENYTRDRYGGGYENYSSSRSDTSVSGREHGGRWKQGIHHLWIRFPPLLVNHRVAQDTRLPKRLCGKPIWASRVTKILNLTQLCTKFSVQREHLNAICFYYLSTTKWKKRWLGERHVLMFHAWNLG